MKKFDLSFLLILIYGICHAQMPESDVWLFKIQINKEKKTILSDSCNLSNRKGYDNQPSFSADEKSIYYVSVREDKQADIYTYNLKSRKITQLTKTAESEYSPQLNDDRKTISVVAVEKDSSQKIHVMDGVTGAFLKSLSFDSVGYYQFLNRDTLIYYKLTQPHSLRMHVVNTGEDKWLCDNPTRGFKKINRSQLIYGIKDSLKVTFYKYDFMLQKALVYCTYPSVNEDAIWYPQWGLMKSEGAKILKYDETKKEWLLCFDLSAFRIKKITRFLFDSQNKYLIIVNNT